MKKTQVQSIFISDCHLCSPYANNELLYNFLDIYKPKNLFIVGDFIDGDYIHNKKRWSNINNNILRKIFKWSVDDVNIVYVLGNHDSFLQKWNDFSFGNIKICREHTYVGVDGQKNLIIHGDQFDVYIGPLIYYVGSVGYNFALFINSLLKKIGLSRISLSKILKNQIKHVAAHICSFERRLIEHAIKNECTQVICGHIHNPAQKTYDWGNYYNCGDWIENNTAIIEHLDGRFEITKFQEKDK